MDRVMQFRCMARYYFDINDGTELLDVEGLEIPDLNRARAEAIRAAGEMIRDLPGKFDGQEWVMQVKDQSKRPVRFTAIEHPH